MRISVNTLAKAFSMLDARNSRPSLSNKQKLNQYYRNNVKHITLVQREDGQYNAECYENGKYLITHEEYELIQRVIKLETDILDILNG